MGIIMYASQQWFCTIKLLRHATMGWAKENELTYNSSKAYIIRLAQEYHVMCYIQSVYLFKVSIYIYMHVLFKFILIFYFAKFIRNIWYWYHFMKLFSFNINVIFHNLSTLFLSPLEWTYFYIDDSVDTTWVGINGGTEWSQVASVIWTATV